MFLLICVDHLCIHVCMHMYVDMQICNVCPDLLWAALGDKELQHLCHATKFDRSKIHSPYISSRHSRVEEKGKATMAWFVSFSS